MEINNITLLTSIPIKSIHTMSVFQPLEKQKDHMCSNPVRWYLVNKKILSDVFGTKFQMNLNLKISAQQNPFLRKRNNRNLSNATYRSFFYKNLFLAGRFKCLNNSFLREIFKCLKIAKNIFEFNFFLPRKFKYLKMAILAGNFK